MKLFSVKQLFEALILFVTMSSLILTGCGGGASTGSAAGTNNVPLTASNFIKTAVGNTWTLSGLDTYTANGSSVTTALSQSKTIISNLNGIATASGVIATIGSGSISNTITDQIDPATGNLIEISNLTGQSLTLLPATIALGSSWTWSASGVQPAEIATIVALNVSRTVPAGTFNDCIQISIASFVVGTRTMSDVFYMSPLTGSAVETHNFMTDVTNNISQTTDWTLQSGYVAH